MIYHKNVRRFFGEIIKDKAKIDGDEFQHLKTVLRSKVGDEIIVLDGSESEYFCTIEEMKKDCAFARVNQVKICQALPRKNIVLFQALTKREKLELITQKAVELGVKKMIPFSSEYCAVKDAIGKKDRLEKIVRGACKQCECSVPMEIGDTLKFSDMIKIAGKLDIVLFANERAGEEIDLSSLSDYQNIGIIVGPEGGFSEKEKEEIISSGAKSITLGKRILRSETASIVLIGLVSVVSKN